MTEDEVPKVVSFPTSPERMPTESFEAAHYRVSFASTNAQLDALQRLRFEVFNLELGEGLEESFSSGRDVDQFDPVCHHLIVTDLRTKEIVGCYRMQTAAMATANEGFYSAGLFDLEALPAEIVASCMEVGRACVARSHRSKHVLFLLWKGLAMYVTHNSLRFLFGCCSLTSQSPREGWSVMRFLEQRHYLADEVRIEPLTRQALEPYEPSAEEIGSVQLPVLFKTYLRYGAKVCGPPAIDREFKTVDFLVVLDVETISARTRNMFFG